MNLTFILSLVLLASAKLSQCCFSDQCADLSDKLSTQLSFSDAIITVESTEFVKVGASWTFAQHPTCSNSISTLMPNATFSFCRVKMEAQTSPSSSIRLESWLPLNWTGRFLSVGNSGFSGCIHYLDMAYAAQRGFAVVGTNNGHDGNTGEPLFNNPGVIEDFVYRAVHTGVQIGKAVTEAMYQQKHTKAYYLGCSTGGRQGFLEAQRFPDDFDGIVAGSPAFDYTGMWFASGRFYSITGPPDSPKFLNADEWQLVLADTLRQCNGIDGHVDSVIEDTDLCQYRPEALICRLGQKEGCLTPTQADTVRRIFAPTYDSHGELVYPRMQPGVESSATLWNGRPFAYSLDWSRYVVFNDAAYDGNMTLEDLETARQVDVYGMDAFDGDLSGAKNSGTKILHYHGLQDGFITSESSTRYYNHVSRTMGLPSAEIDDFYRYFRISGAAHCSRGTGAYNVGNNLASLAGEGPEENMLAAIVRWVEEEKAPDHILGTAFADADKREVNFQRRHCRYPLRNVYKGNGDPDLADSWECI